MEVTAAISEVKKTSQAPARVHTSARRNRSHSRHEKHKCHKHNQLVEDEPLASQVTQLKTENYLLNRRLNASLSSLDSGLPHEGLPSFEIDLKTAYQHIKQENTQLFNDAKNCRVESEKLKSLLKAEAAENACLKDDVTMLKNLVYRLNVELEKYQNFRDQTESDDAASKKYQLPKYYNKDFMKPILPLLRAYTETIKEKNEIIEQLEKKFEKFNASFSEILKENETLYSEVEAKWTNGDISAIDEVQMLRSQLEITKKEKLLFQSQARMESDKLNEIQSAYQRKVSLIEKERNMTVGKLQEVWADVYTLQGKHSVVKQELERMRSEQESKVPLAVHSASVAECKRLFQNLKSEHDSEKLEWLHKLKDCQSKLARRDDELRTNEQERLTLEQSNFDLVFECDELRKKLAEFERSERRSGDVRLPTDDNQQQAQLRDMKLKLADAERRISDLEGRLQRTKKKLEQSMGFAEDVVQEQERLLAQLHEKQKENSAMALTFGSLKKKLKTVEKGAIAGLDSVEDTIRALRDENAFLINEVDRLKEMLQEKEKDAAFETEEMSP